MMPLEPFKLRDHHFATRDQRGSIAIREGICLEDLREAGIGGRFLVRIARGDDDQ
jgi:hypothetical protein